MIKPRRVGLEAVFNAWKRLREDNLGGWGNLALGAVLVVINDIESFMC